MFRFETVVGLVIALMTSGAYSSAEDKKTDCPAAAYKIELQKELRALKKTNKGVTAEDKAEIEELEKNIALADADVKACQSGSRTDSCDPEKAKDKLDAARKEFRNACGPAGFPLSGSQQNFPECSEAIEKCDLCSSKKMAADNPSVCGGSGESESPRSSSFNSEPKIDTESMSRTAEFCPALTAKKKKDLDKKYDESRKEVKDLEKKLPDIQKKKLEAVNKAEDEASQAQDKMVKAQQQLDQELSDAEDKFKEANKQIAAQIVQLQSQIAAADDSIRQLILTKTDAEMAYNEAIKQIELNCHASALNTVSKKQTERLSRPFNHGSFNSMLKNVGLSDRQSWQRLAEKYYRECLRSQPTKYSKSGAKASYESALRKANSAITKFEGDKMRLAEQQMKLKNKVCGPSAGPDLTGQGPEESEFCLAAQKAQSDAQRASRKYGGEANKAAADQQKAARKANNEALSSGMEEAKINRDIAAEKERMRNLRRANEIADEAADNSTDDPKAHDKAKEKYGEFRAEAQKYTLCFKKKDCEADSQCSALNKWLTGIKQDLNVDLEGADPTADENKAGTAAQGRAEQKNPDGVESKK